MAHNVVAVLTAFQVGVRRALFRVVAHGSDTGPTIVINHKLAIDRTQTSLLVDFCHE